ncbi:short-subunit dehydrogenase [Natronobacillus azotifigens]|uniref:SDR family oxidoreductase n=1 Tax=Natronobacillus azotifigens TaxID=472978 RepID=A0A9J6R913_9BACI|nr:SDR family oxidoreductase [Natronobacillus azotifigens]MCZ0701803.1 SDR family oxidoreductase [Natronobacillus azotifigens]
MRNFKGKTIIVTGATSGIGEKTCEQLIKHKAQVIMIARSTEKLKKMQEKLFNLYQRSSEFYTVDLSNQSEWKQTLEEIMKKHQSIDGIINNAGFGIFDHAVTMTSEDIEKMFQVNVFAIMEATKALLPYFMKQKHGHIINIASFAGKIATSKSSIYSATKHAVLGYTNAVRSEVKPYGVYVTSVNLGPVRTAFFQTADPSGAYQKAVSRYMLDPESVAKHIIKNLFKPKREINLPKWMEFGSRMYAMAPGIAEKLMSGSLNKK